MFLWFTNVASTLRVKYQMTLKRRKTYNQFLSILFFIYLFWKVLEEWEKRPSFLWPYVAKGKFITSQNHWVSRFLSFFLPLNRLKISINLTLAMGCFELPPSDTKRIRKIISGPENSVGVLTCLRSGPDPNMLMYETISWSRLENGWDRITAFITETFWRGKTDIKLL